MNITESNLEALKYYLSFGAPELVGEPGETSYTKAECRTLEQGAEVFEYLQSHLGTIGWELACTF